MTKTLRTPITTPIDIHTYTKKFDTYPEDVILFAKEKNISLIPLTSMRGQALALMTQPEVRGQKHINRQDAVQFFKQIGIKTHDAIQAFNKCSGFKRLPMKGLYCLRVPFETDIIDLEKRKGVALPGDRDAAIETIKAWWVNHLVNVPNDAWEIGHLDPTLNDATPTNLAFQPPIQKTYRNRFKFDPYFVKMWPTAAELVPKIDTYYTEEEQKALYDALKEKFEASSPPPQFADAQCRCSLD